MRREDLKRLLIAILPFLLLMACAGSKALKRGREFEKARKFDDAVAYYAKALQEDPGNYTYRAFYERAKAQAALSHLDTGRKLRDAGKLEDALAEFQIAAKIDPSSRLADQETQATEKLVKQQKDKAEEEKRQVVEMIEKSKFSTARELLTPASNSPIILKLTGDLKRAY